MRLMGDFVVDKECALAMLYSFGLIQSIVMLVRDTLIVVKSIRRKSDGLLAVTKAIKNAVLINKSLIAIESLSPRSCINFKDGVKSIGSSWREGGGFSQ